MGFSRGIVIWSRAKKQHQLPTDSIDSLRLVLLDRVDLNCDCAIQVSALSAHTTIPLVHAPRSWNLHKLPVCLQNKDLSLLGILFALELGCSPFATVRIALTPTKISQDPARLSE
jgi:hypothetical protein